MRVIKISKEKNTLFNEQSFRIYMTEISKYPILSTEEEYKVACEAKKGNSEAIDYLIKSNLRFVISVAKQYVEDSFQIEDLVNEGNLGLITAATRFDPTKGFKFISYAVWWIRRSIQEFKSGQQFIKIPPNKLSFMNKFAETKCMLEVKLGYEPSYQDVIDNIENIENFGNIKMTDKFNFTSMDKEIGSEGFSLKDILYGDNNPLDVGFKKEDIKYKMSKLLSELSERDAMIIKMAYGIGFENPMSLQEIGDSIGLTREAVRQIKNKVLIKLKITARRSNITIGDFSNE